MKNLKYLILLVISFFFNVTIFNAYTCTYSSNQVVADSTSGTGERYYGCGQFKLTIDKNGSISSTVIYSNSGIKTGTFVVTQDWKDFINGDFHQECPSVYSGKDERYSSCNIYIGSGNLTDPSDSNVKYVFDYGKNSLDPEDEEEEKPNVGTDTYNIGGTQGHKYYNALSCANGYSLKNIYISAADTSAIGCVADKLTGDYNNITCQAGSSIGYYGIKTGDTSKQYHIVVCENINTNKEELDEQFQGSGNITHVQTIPFPDITDCQTLLGSPNDTGSPAYYLVFAFKVVRYVAIILLIVLSVIEFVTATASSDQESITKATKKTIRRFVLCIVIFALPTLLNFGLNFLYDRKMEVCGITQSGINTSENEGAGSQ